MDGPKKTISDSRCKSWVRCPVAYEFRYVKGIKMAPSWAITGRSAHAAEEANFVQKLKSFEDMALEDVKDIAAETFEKEAAGPEEVIWDEGEAPGAAKDRTIAGVSAYHTNIAPTVQPILVEESVSLTLPWGTELTGRIDVVDADTTIRDTKHVSYKPGAEDHMYETQPGVYGYAFAQMMDQLPKFKFDYIVLGNKTYPKAVPTAITVETTLTQERVDRTIDRIHRVERAIDSGIVYPIASKMNCVGCGYRRICPWVSK